MTRQETAPPAEQMEKQSNDQEILKKIYELLQKLEQQTASDPQPDQETPIPRTLQSRNLQVTSQGRGSRPKTAKNTMAKPRLVTSSIASSTPRSSQAGTTMHLASGSINQRRLSQETQTARKPSIPSDKKR
jgi:hypothetical protein